MSTHLMGDGLTMVEVRQGYVSLSGPMKEIERYLLRA
jgi:phage terminase large subunit-like protein